MITTRAHPSNLVSSTRARSYNHMNNASLCCIQFINSIPSSRITNLCTHCCPDCLPGPADAFINSIPSSRITNLCTHCCPDCLPGPADAFINSIPSSRITNLCTHCCPDCLPGPADAFQMGWATWPTWAGIKKC